MRLFLKNSAILLSLITLIGCTNLYSAAAADVIPTKYQGPDAYSGIVLPGSGQFWEMGFSGAVSVSVVARSTGTEDLLAPYSQSLNESGVMAVADGLIPGQKLYKARINVPLNTPVAKTFTLTWTATSSTGNVLVVTEGSFSTGPAAAPVDSQNPVVVVGSGVLTTSTLPSSGGAVSVTYRVTDDVGCCGYHQAWMYYPNGTVVQQVTPSQSSGDAKNGTFRASFNVPSGAVAGSYQIKAQATDLTGKYTQLQLLGTVTVSAPVALTKTDIYITSDENFKSELPYAFRAALAQNSRPIAGVTVTFWIDGDPRASAVTDSLGIAIWRQSSHASGKTSYSVYATYGGSSTLAASTSPTRVITKYVIQKPIISITSGAVQSVLVNSPIADTRVSNSGGPIYVDGYVISPALPSGLVLNTGNGVIYGTPTVAQTQRIYSLTATGPGGVSNAVTFTLTVTEVNTPPTINLTSPLDNQTVTGLFKMYGTATVATGSSAKIERVCLTIDGSPIIDGYANSGTGIPRAWVNRISSGCIFTYANSGSIGFGWNLDPMSFSNGTHVLSVKVFDTSGRESESIARTFMINRPPPTLSITSPKSGDSVAGVITLEIAMNSTIGGVLVGISAPNAEDSDYHSRASLPAQGVPANIRLWNAGSEKTFKWQMDTKQLPLGMNLIEFYVVDAANQVVKAQIYITVVSTKPTISIVSPKQDQTVKGKLTIRAIIDTSRAAGRSIAYVGISEANAKSNWGGEYAYSRLPGKYSDFSVTQDIVYSFDAVWTIDYSSSQLGLKEIWIAVQDSSGEIAEQKVTFTLEKAKPVLKIISPVSASIVPGIVTLKVNAMADPETTGKISKIAVSSTNFTPQFKASNAYCNLDANYQCWSVDDLKDFTWTSKPQGFRDGTVTLTVVIFDDRDNSSSLSVTFLISAVSPTLVINSPSASIINKEQVTISITAKPNIESNSEIIGAAITEKNALPQFPGSIVTTNLYGIPTDALIWKVAGLKELSWRINPANWSEGEHVINVFVIDSNGKIGQSSVVLYLAPEPAWKLKIEDLPILGQSVPVSVSMTTRIPILQSPKVLVRMQSGPTELGPWTDLGVLTLDQSGTATGNVLVTKELYVRVNHEQLDAVLPGASDALRIVYVPASNGIGKLHGKRNPDGSLPLVTCTAKNSAKLKEKVVITCSAKDVQIMSQPVKLMLQQKTGAPKLIRMVELGGTRISTTFTSALKGVFTLQLAGSGGSYVPWTSNNISIKFQK